MDEFAVGDVVSVLHTASRQTYSGVLMSIQNTGGVDWIMVTPGLAFPLTDVILSR